MPEKTWTVSKRDLQNLKAADKKLRDVLRNRRSGKDQIISAINDVETSVSAVLRSLSDQHELNKERASVVEQYVREAPGQIRQAKARYQDRSRPGSWPAHAQRELAAITGRSVQLLADSVLTGRLS